MKKIIEDIIKQACIEARWDQFITPIVQKASVKLKEELKRELLKEMPRDIEVDMVMGTEHSDYAGGYEQGYNQSRQDSIAAIERVLG